MKPQDRTLIPQNRDIKQSYTHLSGVGSSATFKLQVAPQLNLFKYVAWKQIDSSYDSSWFTETRGRHVFRLPPPGLASSSGLLVWPRRHFSTGASYFRVQ